ncbi:MAG: FAD:protein FMN transferase [Geminicoccaceae bacterium]
MKLARRRFIGIAAASVLSGPAAGGAAFDVRWQGQALGAEANIVLAHHDRRRADAVLSACQEEIRRLENIFSLFRRDSAIVRLNQDGRLDGAPAALIELLGIARHFSELSDGAFDITVQPLWQAFSRGGNCPERVKAALELVDWRQVHVDGRAISFGRPNMAITLNGIAQGYITDRVTAMLRVHGFDRVLVNMGEYRGLGRRADGRPWRVGIGRPDGRGLFDNIALENRAIATSSPLGTSLGCEGNALAHHLFNPKTGRPATGWRSVSVIADRAAIADGLSTTIAVAEPSHAERLLKEGGGRRAILLSADGQRIDIQSGTGFSSD